MGANSRIFGGNYSKIKVLRRCFTDILPKGSARGSPAASGRGLSASDASTTGRSPTSGPKRKVGRRRWAPAHNSYLPFDFESVDDCCESLFPSQANADPIVPERDPRGWRIGEPDLVVTVATPVKVPATGVVDYLIREAGTKLTESVWVDAMQIRCEHPEICHHVLAHAIYRDEKSSEFVDSYEAGWKQTWADWGLTTNAAVFLYKYTDAQAPLGVVTTNPTTLQQTTSTQFVNLPEVETTGFELEGNWNPIDPLNIGFTYAYLNAEITQSDVYLDPSRDARCHSSAAPATSATCVATVGPTFANIVNDATARRSVEGNTLSQTPKNKVAINASYRIDMEDGSYFLPTISYSWRDKFFDSFFNNANEESPAYDNVDARLNWKSADEILGLTLWVRNLTDATQNTSVSANGFRNTDSGRYQTFSYTPPRMFGVDLLVHY